MLTQEINRVVSHDHWVEHPQGRIFVRSWSVASVESMQAAPSPIILFHDSLGCVDLWREFPAQLCTATNCPVIAYDRLGFGRSERRTDKLGLDFIADEIQNFFPVIRKHLGLQRFIVFGHSVGGSMGVHCAAQFPQDCAAVITESAQVFPENRTLSAIALAKEQFSDPAQLRRLEKCHFDKSPWVVEAWTGTWLDPAFASWTLAGILPQVTCPILAIHGMLDEYGSTCQPEMIAGLTGGPSRVEILENTRHVPHREQPKVIVDLVSHFLEFIR